MNQNINCLKIVIPFHHYHTILPYQFSYLTSVFGVGKLTKKALAPIFSHFYLHIKALKIIQDNMILGFSFISFVVFFLWFWFWSFFCSWIFLSDYLNLRGIVSFIPIVFPTYYQKVGFLCLIFCILVKFVWGGVGRRVWSVDLGTSKSPRRRTHHGDARARFTTTLAICQGRRRARTRRLRDGCGRRGGGEAAGKANSLSKPKRGGDAAREGKQRTTALQRTLRIAHLFLYASLPDVGSPYGRKYIILLDRLDQA